MQKIPGFVYTWKEHCHSEDALVQWLIFGDWCHWAEEIKKDYALIKPHIPNDLEVVNFPGNKVQLMEYRMYCKGIDKRLQKEENILCSRGN